MRGLHGSGNIQLRELGAFGGHLETARAYTSLRHAWLPSPARHRVERPPCLAQHLVEMGHGHLQLAIVEHPPLEPGERRQC